MVLPVWTAHQQMFMGSTYEDLLVSLQVLNAVIHAYCRRRCAIRQSYQRRQQAQMRPDHHLLSSAIQVGSVR